MSIPGALLRAGLEAVLSEVPDFSLAAGAASDSEADVWVCTYSSEQREDLAARISGRPSPAAVLFISDGQTGFDPPAGLPLKAWGVLPVDSEPAAVEAAIRALSAGLVVGSPEYFARQGLQGKEMDNPPELVEPLTEREVEVLQLLSRGLSNKQIATLLMISDHTVKFHVASICGKLGAANRTEAVRLGLQHGLVSM